MTKQNENPVPKKHLGQNFLVNENIASDIIRSIPFHNKWDIFEIGPGRGILTGRLLDRGCTITAIEIDSDLCRELSRMYKSQIPERLKLECMDVLEFLDKTRISPDTFFVSNLPYNISTPIIVRLLDFISFDETGKPPFGGALLMFQKEFAERLISIHGKRTYGRISVTFQLKMGYEKVMEVDKDNFFPRPRVDSVVVLMTPRKKISPCPKDPALFDRILRHSFSNRRKMLKNSLRSLVLKRKVDHDVFRGLLQREGFSDLRPEQLSPDDFVNLSDLLGSIGL